ncbi:Aldo/keto reductase family [Phytophthora infestans]|uniref:Aldo/keto reductase family n=1 Tax=Phytophthora infestans TaxID=4787 RepID=A0A833WAD6_PHYIN|nr:Aldo/keto reductase family [Phytophthora infestans]
MEYGETKSPELWYEIMKTAFEHGISFFDNADSYGMGLEEEYTGAAIKMGIQDGTWKREGLVVATKLGMGTKGFHGDPGLNDQGLTRKHITKGLKASLKRMDLEYVDVLYCIRQDPYTPLEGC